MAATPAHLPLGEPPDGLPARSASAEDDAAAAPGGSRLVSVVVPAHNEADTIQRTVADIFAQVPPGVRLEVIVADDGSTDDTVARARASGATVIRLEGPAGNPAAARNRGAAASAGDPIVFLDADCTPLPGWLAALLAAHDRGEVVVGGALELPPGLPASARCDFYCGWYLVHPARPAGPVPHHPPPNLSVRREAFLSTSGFTERQPYAYTNEERHWQAELRARGQRIWFEPKAAAYHWNRRGYLNLLRRSYRWAYTAIPAKTQTGTARMAWLYRYPLLAVAGSVPLAVGQTFYILGCWVRAGIWEPLALLPAILLSRMAYAAGMTVGGVRWMLQRGDETSEVAPRWR